MNDFRLQDLMNQLHRGVIVSVCKSQDDYIGLVIQTPDKKVKKLWFLMDDEGNGPGSYQISIAS